MKSKKKTQSKTWWGAVLIGLGSAGIALANYFGFPDYSELILTLLTAFGTYLGVYGIRDAIKPLK